MRFRDRISRFFMGRYGADQLYYALFVFYFILWIVLLFVPFSYLRIVLSLLQLFVLIYMIFRVLSRNIAARRRENEIFLKLFNSLKNFFKLTKNRFRDIKTHRYRKCPHCKATLRLPKRKGEHPVICPRCKQRFKVKVFF